MLSNGRTVRGQMSSHTKPATAKHREAVTLHFPMREMTWLYLRGTFGCAEHNVLGNTNVEEQNITSVEIRVKCWMERENEAYKAHAQGFLNQFEALKSKILGEHNIKSKEFNRGKPPSTPWSTPEMADVN